MVDSSIPLDVVGTELGADRNLPGSLLGLLGIEGLIPGSLDAYVPTTLASMVMSLAERMYLQSFDRLGRKYSHTFKQCLLDATEAVCLSLDGEMVRRRFEVSAKLHNVVDVYEVTSRDYLLRNTLP